MATSYYNRGLGLGSQGRLSDAGNHFVVAVRINPTFSEADKAWELTICRSENSDMTARVHMTKTSSVAVRTDKQMPAFQRRDLWAAIFLIAITAVAYLPVLHYGFVNFDDPGYVTRNPQVTGGLTLQNALWSLTSGREANWHPVTWLSHMLDVQLYGLNAGGHHLTNLLLHIANTLLLFWLLFRTTGSRVRSAFVAALFAVHPLHVESVAWIAERKDVLSTFFWMLTLCAYVLYVRQPVLSRYLPVIAFFALGLAAKPMLVTLPFVLLLLDFWPLGRMKTPASGLKLAGEKIPLLILAATSSVITLIVQRKAMLEAVPLADRIGNAFISYFAYARKMFWPADLAVMYPIETPSHWWMAALGVVVLTVLSIWIGSRRPYIPVGWFWYLGTLVPVIGLVQVGGQALADRYTYVPLIGLFIIIAFSIPEPSAKPKLVLAVSGLAIIACAWMTRVQVQYWSTSLALWEHALSTTKENSVAHYNLALTLKDEGRLDEADRHYSEALRIQTQSGSAQSRYKLAVALTNNGESGDELGRYFETLRMVRDRQKHLEPDEEAQVHYNLGLGLASEGKLDDAAEHFAEAVRINPNFPEAHNSLGTRYLLEQEFDKAIREFSEAIRLKPDYAIAHNNLGTAFGNEGHLERAIAEYTEALRLEPGYAEAHTNLGVILAKQGKKNDAIAQFSETLRINPENSTARTWLATLTNKSAPAR